MAQIRATVSTISTLASTLILMFPQRSVPVNRPQQVRFLSHRIRILPHNLTAIQLHSHNPSDTPVSNTR